MSGYKFALVGAAGYVAPRHMRAIKETGNELVAALDRSDSVGVIDSYFPESAFFVEFERFDRHLDLLARKGHRVDYVSIVSPNYLHDSHIRFALRHKAHAICEKPLVLNPHNIDALQVVQDETGCKVYNILQLRLHPVVIDFKKKIQAELRENPDKVVDIDLTYITSRGRWYAISWKGDESKSGGVATNIGVHFFDMLTWIFGDVTDSQVHHNSPDTCSGLLSFNNARVRWFLSTNADYLAGIDQDSAMRTHRSITVNGEELEFSGGFTDLHTLSYEHILSGQGFELGEAKPSIEIVSNIRQIEVKRSQSDEHPFMAKVG